ncbi:hypothetical protein EE612_015306 [Oryza sativa]|nr:hypothetical protein EE612_015306 [Oryza sativa]
MSLLPFAVSALFQREARRHRWTSGQAWRGGKAARRRRQGRRPRLLGERGEDDRRLVTLQQGRRREVHRPRQDGRGHREDPRAQRPCRRVPGALQPGVPGGGHGRR